MRKLKKSLAVLLVLVMALAMVPFASASVTTAANFNDAADVSSANLMAVDVMAALGILRGEDGNIFPNRTITRAEAAAIVTRTLIGPAAADQLPPARTGFRDVDGVSGIDAWASGPIGFLHERGIVVGIGDNLFDPLANVTGAELAVMLLRAAGFGVNGEYTGPRWQTNAVVDGMHWRILTGDADFTAPATREEVFRYAFNAMNTNELPTQLQFVNWSADRQAYVPVTLQVGTTTRLDTIYGRIFNPSPINLVRHGGTDDFGRPVTRFTLRGQEIGTYATAAAVTFTQRETESAVNAAIDNFIRRATTTSLVNGRSDWDFDGTTSNVVFGGGTGLISNANLGNRISRLTGHGVLVEVFVSAATSEITTVTAIRTDISEVIRTSSTEVRVAPLTADDTENTRNALFASGNALNVGPLNSNFADLRELAVADLVLVTPVWRDSAWHVGEIAIPETVTGILRAASNFTAWTATGSLTVGETVYRRAAVLSAGARNATVQNVGEEVVLVLDTYGFVVHTRGTTASRQDVIIARATPNALVGGIIQPMIRGYFPDGTAVDRVVDNGYGGAIPQILTITGNAPNRTAVLAPRTTSVAATGTNTSLVFEMPAGAFDLTANQAAMSLSGVAVRFADDAQYFFWNAATRNYTITGRTNNISVPATATTWVVLEYRGTNVAPVISAVVFQGVRQQGELNLETLRFLRQDRVGITTIPDGTMLDDARLLDIFGTSTTVTFAANTDLSYSRWVAATVGAHGVYSVVDVADQVGTNLGVFSTATVNALDANARLFQIVGDDGVSTFVTYNTSTVFLDFVRIGNAAITNLNRFGGVVADDNPNNTSAAAAASFSVAVNAHGVATVIIAH